MPSIFDRCRIDPHRIPKVENAYAHSYDVASLAVRIAAAAYAFTSDIDRNSESNSDGVRDIPFKSMKRYLATSDDRKESEWYGKERSPDSFSISVSGGAAYGVLLSDFIFVGFRGTTNVPDWSINLFGLGSYGPQKCPLSSNHFYRKLDRRIPIQQVADAQLHAGFYRVAQALRRPLSEEIDKLVGKFHDHHNSSAPKIILTGHSLGGALALLSGSFLNYQSIYTFGMPRVCSGSLIQELPSRHYRYVLEGDPVPKLPFESMGFRHDMPCLLLDPYRGLPKPGLISKAIRGFRKGVTLSGSFGKGAMAVLAYEHDVENYVDTVMSQ